MKNAVITGANSGIGLALSQHFMNQGYHVHGLDLRSDNIDKMDSENITFHHIDVTHYEDLNRIAEELKPELWINNAGIAAIGTFDEVPVEKSARVIEINLLGVIYGTKAAINHMKKGHIVNIASVAGHCPAPHLSSYVASKHGVVGFTRTVQQELALKKLPLHLLLVSPGFINTNIINRIDEGLEFPKEWQWIVEEVDSVVKSIDDGIKKKKDEVNPTLHGKALIFLQRANPFILNQLTKQAGKKMESAFTRVHRD